jgi:hypothetical protein
MKPQMNADLPSPAEAGFAKAGERRYESSRAVEPAPDLIRGAQTPLSAFIPSYLRSSVVPFVSVNLCGSVPLWFKANGSIRPV